MIRCGGRNERFFDGSVFGEGSPARIFWALHLAAVSLLGFTRRPRVTPGSPGSDGASPTILSDPLSLEQSFSILLWGSTVARG
jgi:hypothetical protein